jgi:hypothetical protein
MAVCTRVLELKWEVLLRRIGGSMSRRETVLFFACGDGLAFRVKRVNRREGSHFLSGGKANQGMFRQ